MEASTRDIERCFLDSLKITSYSGGRTTMEEQDKEERKNDTRDEFSARPYQVDLYEVALSKNTIIYLPTGSGKTFIAVMLLKKLSGDIQKAYSKGGKRTVFVVNTVPLVIQQTEYIARHTGLACRGYNGEMGVDYWSMEQWAVELDTYQVLVLTAQILVDLLHHGSILLKKINLIIFDECHRAVDDHPMRQIMKCFETCPVNDQPRVLALSATLLNANVKVNKVQNIIEHLETTFQATVATPNSNGLVQDYSTNPIEKMVTYQKYIPPSSIINANKLLDTVIDITKVIDLTDIEGDKSSACFQTKSKSSKLIGILQDVREHLVTTGLYGGSKAILGHMVQLEVIKRNTEDEKAVSVIQFVITQLTKLRKMLHDEMKENSEIEQINKFSSDQVKTLFKVIKHFHESKQNHQKFCAIIFVKRRFTAKVLYHVLKNLQTCDNDFNFLVPEYMVGNSKDTYKNFKENLCISKWNKEALQRFRNGHSNCIIATDIIDEGVDIPNCTLIVRFDLPMDFRSYIQSKGRARHATSQYVLMIEATEKDQFYKRYLEYRKVEEFLRQMLVGKTSSRLEVTAEQVKQNLYHFEIPPYTVVGKDGVASTITEVSAISLVNRYCSALYKSKFIHLAPVWKLHTIENKRQYQVSLKLPIISPVKEEIYGFVMPSIDSAKRSVAMEACKKLHQKGELSERLLPINQLAFMPNDEYLFPNWKEEAAEEGVLPGTNRKKRLHELKPAPELYEAYPKANAMLFLHVLHMVPTYSQPYDNRHLTFYELLNSRKGFGILSTKKMPKIHPFPIYMNVGELKVDVQVNHTTKGLNEAEIDKLKLFHTTIFSHVVPVLQPFMVFDTQNGENSFLIVPLDENWNINWDVVDHYQDMTLQKKQPSVPVHVTHSTYDRVLVAPNYRASTNVYIVTQICDDMSPESSFPTDAYYSYARYYEERHGVTILDLKQPMLEVKPVSAKINCIKPRSIKPGMSKRKRADLLEEFDEHLVPELCYIIDFPSLYWLKATTLPSILHRISHLLIAEDLRRTIASEAKLGVLCLPENRELTQLAPTEKEIEEPEHLLDQTCDETVDICEHEPEVIGPDVDVLDSEDNLYPWTKEEEPPDLGRNIEHIQLIDIEYYQQFITSRTNDLPQSMQSISKKITYMAKPDVSVPPLQVLLGKNTYGPESIDIIKALTSIMGNDMFNLERLETLGDSFLKFITSLYLYQNFPSYNEGRLTALKGRIIGNRNLFYCGKMKDIPGRMKVEEFVPNSNYITPCYTVYRPLQKKILENQVPASALCELSVPLSERLNGSISKNIFNDMEAQIAKFLPTSVATGMEHFLGVQYVSDKTVADAVEALIGVYLLDMGLQGATKLLTWFKILPESLIINDLLYGEVANPQIGSDGPNSHMPWADSMEKKVGYKFKNRAYLLQAFTHPSYTANRVTECYQRLEFLGDAIIDFLITVYIYETSDTLNPGELTDLRSALVNNITFACLAVRYGLHTAILAYAPKQTDAIDRFVKFQEERNHVVNDELLWVLLEEEDCNMAEYIDVPKILGDIFESLIGAIYLDSGKDIHETWNILYALMHKELDAFSKDVPKQPVRMLFETQGARPKFLKPQVIEGTGNTMVPLEVVISGKIKTFYGFGAAKEQAKRAAAKQALKCLRYKK